MVVCLNCAPWPHSLPCISVAHLGRILGHTSRPYSGLCVSATHLGRTLGRASRSCSRPRVLLHVFAMLVQPMLFGYFCSDHCPYLFSPLQDVDHLIAGSAVAMRQLAMFGVVLVQLLDCLCLANWRRLSDCCTFVRSYGRLCHRLDMSSSSSNFDSEDDEPNQW